MGYANTCHHCGQSPHSARCPSYVDKPVYVCDNCGEGIFDGEVYLEVAGTILCECCASEHKFVADAEKVKEAAIDYHRNRRLDE